MLRARFIMFLLYPSRSCLKGSLSLISSAFFSLCSLLSFVINTILLASSPRLNISLLSDLRFLICLPIIVFVPTFLTVPTFSQTFGPLNLAGVRLWNDFPALLYLEDIVMLVAQN